MSILNEVKRAKAGGGGTILQQVEAYQAPEIDQEAYNAQMHSDMGMGEKALVGLGHGFNTIGKALGMDEGTGTVGGLGFPVTPDEQGQQAFDQLADESLVAAGGDIVGKALPFVPLGGVAGAAQKLLTRVLGSGAVGIMEGVTIARGEGGDGLEQLKAGGTGGALAGAMEVIFPVLGRLGRQVFARLGRTPKGALLTPDGEPTAEFTIALKEAGTSFEDLADEAVEFIASQKPGTSPKEAARLARFDSLGIPATKGDISQDFAQQATEQRLMSMAGGDSAQPLRDFKANQASLLESKIRDTAGALGNADEAGESVKAALEGRKTALRGQRKALYDEAASLLPDLAIPTARLEEALPNPTLLRRLRRHDDHGTGGLEVLLAEFGLDSSEDALKALEREGASITPLTLANADEFRQALNNYLGGPNSAKASVVVKPIISALDSALDDVAEGGAGVGVLKDARKVASGMKTEFSPQSIAGRLIDVKKDGVTPVVEASKVVNELSTKPVEQLQKTLSSLHKSGKQGVNAIGDMKAAVILNALEDALKAPSRKVAGEQLMGGNQFAKSLDKFGADRLNMLFRGDKKGLRQLEAIKQTALDIMPSADAMPKGSAPVILDILKRAGRAPGIAAMVDFATFVVKAGADDRAVNKALKAKPEYRRVISKLEQDFPAIAGALGVAGIVEEQE